MDKVKVSTGIYWVEVPEANLYVLCGCPADSVKHLMKMGLILPKEKDGIEYETGPNAILLSDLPLQHGSFANLSEFPVLQMLYRQGMLLPDHPNNTGLKPMLIGIPEQVEAQSQYIYRGNYGLKNQQEIEATGVSPEQALEMMRVKKWFAFDKIKETEDLLDLREVEGAEAVELRDGVFIKRKGFNQYEFEYKGKTVDVDLSIPEGRKYEPAFHLGFHTLKREYFSVVHIGEGDGWDVNRACMSSLICFQGRLYLIDAGPNIENSLTALGISVNEIEGVFHTHAHDDHFCGLTTLVRAGRLIKYYATPLVRSSVEKKFAALTGIEERLFADFFEVHDLDFDEWNDVGGLQVKPVLSPHPVETSVMFFGALGEDGFKTYAHLADTASFSVLDRMVTDDPGKSGISEEYNKEVRDMYLEPVALKKIDIGGGLIHGEAMDYTDDESGKIILCHKAEPLTDEEKESGSNATFGMQDVLIKSNRDYALETTRKYLGRLFPGVSRNELDMLANSSLVEFNVGSIIIKNGLANENIFLISSGVLEYIESSGGTANTVSAGSLIGELSGIMDVPARGTYRAASYVQALQIPCGLYVEFARRNDLYEDIMRIHYNRQFLSGTCLFGEMLSYQLQSRIARHMDVFSCSSGQAVKPEEEGKLLMVEEGAVEIRFDGKTVDTLSPGCFFGEEKVLFDAVPPFDASAIQDSSLFSIPGELIKDIPIIRWKLFEAFEKRQRATL